MPSEQNSPEWYKDIIEPLIKTALVFAVTEGVTSKVANDFAAGLVLILLAKHAYDKGERRVNSLMYRLFGPPIEQPKSLGEHLALAADLTIDGSVQLFDEKMSHINKRFL